MLLSKKKVKPMDRVLDIHIRYPEKTNLGSWTQLEKGMKDLMSALSQVVPVLQTLNKNKGEIERIIRVVAKNEKQITAIVESAARIAPVIQVAVKQVEPLLKQTPGQDDPNVTDLTEFVKIGSWVARNPGIIGAGLGVVVASSLLAGGYAFYKIAKKEK